MDIKSRKEDFVTRLKKENNFTLVGEYSGHHGNTDFLCNRCGNIFKASPMSTKTRKSCPACRNFYLGKSKPMIETNKELSSYLKNPEDAKKFSEKTGASLLWKCQDCGGEFYRSPGVFRDGIFKCKYCWDGVSFPNKMMFFVLKCLDIKFEPEKTFLWSRFKNGEKFIYDFYIVEKNIIIEMMGSQHYDNNAFFAKRSKRDIKETDEEKKNLSLKNNISKYFQIDARLSEFELIKKSIVANLCDVFDLSKVDWEYVFKHSYKSILVEVCKYYDEHTCANIAEISEYFKMGRSTIGRYLNLGGKHNLCTYTVEDMKRRKSLHIKESAMKKKTEKASLIFSLYLSGLTKNEICNMYNIGIRHVGKLLTFARKLQKLDKTVDEIKKINDSYNIIRTAIFEYIKNNPNDSMVEISKKTGYSYSAVSKYAKEGVSEGIIEYSTDKSRDIARIKSGKSRRIGVSKFDRCGNFIISYDSISQAAKCECIDSGAICGVLKGTYKLCCNSIWRYTKDGSPTQDEILKANTRDIINRRAVIQYDLNLNFIKCYASISLAEKESGANYIHGCLAGKNKTAGGYIWKYAEQ